MFIVIDAGMLYDFPDNSHTSLSRIIPPFCASRFYILYVFPSEVIGRVIFCSTINFITFTIKTVEEIG